MNEQLTVSADFTCEYRPNPKNKRIKLSYRNARGFLVTYPPRTSIKSVRRFVESNQEWMQNVVDKRQPTNQSHHLRSYLEEHPTLILNGLVTEINFTSAGGLMKRTDHTVSFFSDITENQLIRKLQILAKEPLTTMLMRLAGEAKLEVLKVQIRDQKSRWGSCSSRKSISLNWRLILMPNSLQEHIILHELAHLIHPNHSHHFWDLLKSWDPHFDENNRILKEHGSNWINLGR